MSAISRIGRGVSDAAIRFVDRSLPEDDRERQLRLACVMLTAPLALGVLSCVVAASNNRSVDALAGLTASFAIAAMAMMATRLGLRWKSLLGGSLAAMSVFLGWIIAGAGGLASPLLLLVFALPFEAFWAGRDRSALVAGVAAATAVVSLLLIIGLIGQPAAAFTAWHWLAPLTYAGIVAPRALGLRARVPHTDVKTPTTLEDVIDGVILRLDGAGQVTEVGGKLERMIGIAPGLVLGESFFERIHVADRVVYLQAAAQVRETGLPKHAEFRVRIARDGQTQPVFANFSADFYPGEPMLLLLRANSEIEALKASVASLREDLAKAEVAKAAFLATVSHELRTPLNSIIGFADMLAFEIAGKFSDPRQREYASLIRDSGSHLLSVVNAILDISRIESRAYPVNCEPFAFADAASACHAMLAVQANANSIELRNSAGPAIGEIRADRRAVQQILINLLSNAIKFTPAGGTVRLEARRKARTITFEVHDNGIGMSPEDLARVGRPFVQAKSDYAREHDGVGLGLSIAKGLVALHEGAMSISSAPGAGTVVSVTLPIDGPAAAVSPEGELSQEEMAHGPFRKSA